MRSRAELAELSARVNWYLPAACRNVDVVLKGARDFGDIGPGDAPAFTPELVEDPGWRQAGAATERHRVIHRLDLRGVLAYLSAPRRASVVDSRFAYGSDETYFRLARRFAPPRVPAPSPRESIARIHARATPGGTALVMATGPSARLVTPLEMQCDLRVTCNSALRDHELIAHLRPTVVAFSDPVFHFGPSRYAAAFRDDLRYALENSDALFVTSQLFVEPLLCHMPEIASRLAVLPLSTAGTWRAPTVADPTVRITGNVLTNLMLPVALALGAGSVAIAGCDGRDPEENYYWKHNARSQYSDELMLSAFDAHPAFFRDRDYADYYDEHCQQLEELIQVAEQRGVRVAGLTPSHIPALKKRGAPAFTQNGGSLRTGNG